MIYLYDYRTVKRHQEERIRRSLSRAPNVPSDEYVSPVEKQDADVFEVEFGTWCDSHPMGA